MSEMTLIGIRYEPQAPSLPPRSGGEGGDDRRSEPGGGQETWKSALGMQTPPKFSSPTPAQIAVPPPLTPPHRFAGGGEPKRRARNPPSQLRERRHLDAGGFQLFPHATRRFHRMRRIAVHAHRLDRRLEPRARRGDERADLAARDEAPPLGIAAVGIDLRDRLDAGTLHRPELLAQRDGEIFERTVDRAHRARDRVGDFAIDLGN